jgi:hypothetical protein
MPKHQRLISLHECFCYYIDLLWITCAEVRCEGAEGILQDLHRETKARAEWQHMAEITMAVLDFESQWHCGQHLQILRFRGLRTCQTCKEFFGAV